MEPAVTVTVPDCLNASIRSFFGGRSMRRLDRNVDDAGSDQPTKRRRSLTPFFSKGVHRYPYLTPSLSPREGGVGGWLVGWFGENGRLGVFSANWWTSGLWSRCGVMFAWLVRGWLL